MIAGQLYAAGSTKAQPAHLLVRGGVVLLRRGADEEQINLARVQVSARLGSVPRRLTLADGRIFETTDNNGIDRLFAYRRDLRPAGVMARLERFNPWLIVTILVLAAIGYLSLSLGLPLIADGVVAAAPYSVEEDVGETTLTEIDALILKPSELAAEKRAAIEASFTRLLRAADLPYSRARLEFRNGGGIGANAFALPGGVVVVTDELVKLMGGNHAAIEAVLAHELGHAHHRHGFKMLARAMGIGIISLALTGDVASLSSVAVGLVESTARNAFSRGFEREADEFSVDLMRRAGRPPGALASALAKLAETEGNSVIPRYLASHPPTAERIAAVRARAQAQAMQGQAPQR